MATYEEMSVAVQAAMRRECRSTPNAGDIAASLGILRVQQPINEQEMGDPTSQPGEGEQNG